MRNAGRERYYSLSSKDHGLTHIFRGSLAGSAWLAMEREQEKQKDGGSIVTQLRGGSLGPKDDGRKGMSQRVTIQEWVSTHGILFSCEEERSFGTCYNVNKPENIRLSE